MVEKKKESKPKGKRADAALKVKLVRSVIGSTERQRAAVLGLGLRRIRQVVELEDTPEIRGMVNKVSHLVEIVG